MTRDEFWVVGGSFRDVSFAALERSTGEVHGPFPSYAEALVCWRERAAVTRSQATTRFTVVTTAGDPNIQRESQRRNRRG
jgi:hypothetical protein